MSEKKVSEIQEFLTQKTREIARYFDIEGKEIDNALMLFVNSDIAGTCMMHGSSQAMVTSITSMMVKSDVVKMVVADALLLYFAAHSNQEARAEFMAKFLTTNGAAEFLKKDEIKEKCEECEEEECPIHPGNKGKKDSTGGDDIVKRKPCAN